MSNSSYEQGRFFLKDTIRKQVDFRGTAQNRGEPPPPLQKPVPGNVPRVALPEPAALMGLGRISLAKAIADRQSVRRYADKPLRRDELAFLLWATQGVREVVSPACALRTVPSAGARHSFETYLAVSRVRDLEPGLYRFLPFDNELALLRADGAIATELAGACFAQGFVARAAVSFIWTSIPARVEWRYDRAAHKVIALDAGHVCQNLYLACEAVACGTCAIAAYDQETVDALVGVDGSEEFTVYVAPVGKKG